MLASANQLNPQSWNRYAYVLNSPLNLVDPDGKQNQDPLAEKARQMRQSTANEPITTTTTVSNTGLQLHPEIQTPQDLNQQAGPLTGETLQNADQAMLDVESMIAEQPGVVNPCRNFAISLGLTDPNEAVNATHTTGGVAMLDPDGRVTDGPQNVLNGSTSAHTVSEGGRNITVPDYFRADSTIRAITYYGVTYLESSRFNAAGRAERAVIMFHERLVHAAAHRTDLYYGPTRAEGSRNINQLIRRNCPNIPH